MALALLLCACESAGLLGRLEVTLVAPESPDPFEGVDRIRMLLRHPTFSGLPEPVSFRRGETGNFPPVPPGPGYILHFEGLSGAGELLSAGCSPPLTIEAQTAPAKLHVLFGSANRFNTLAQASAARVGHTVTLLEDGRVVVLGGITGDTAARPVVLAETILLFDPREVRASERGRFERFDHAATLLPGGRILLSGGRDANGTPLSALEIWEPGTLQPAPAAVLLPEPRASHTASLLPDGRVLIAGGVGAAGTPVSQARILALGEMRFETSSSSLSVARHDHSATVLESGAVLLAGGRNEQGVLDSAELYVPGEGMVQVPSPMRRRRALHTTSPFAGRRVLFAGGTDGSTVHRTFEIFDEASRRFLRVTDDAGVELSMLVARARHVAASLSVDSVLVAGGGDPAAAPQTATGTAFLLRLADRAETPNDVEMTMTNVAPLARARLGAAATVTPDGNVIVIGGEEPDGSSPRAVGAIELFIPSPPPTR